MIENRSSSEGVATFKAKRNDSMQRTQRDAMPTDSLALDQLSAPREQSITELLSKADLPAQHIEIVRAALATRTAGELSTFVHQLARIGGLDSAKALGVLLSEATTDRGLLAEHSLGGRHAVVYRLCFALLKVADVKWLRKEGQQPLAKLTKTEKREVVDFVRYLAKGDHGDTETAAGARSLLFERISNIPGVGASLELALRAAAKLEGRGPSSPPSLLFKLFDLPWRMSSRMPTASQDSRRTNLGEILHQAVRESRRG